MPTALVNVKGKGLMTELSAAFPGFEHTGHAEEE